jgi:hypothetical protein
VDDHDDRKRTAPAREEKLAVLAPIVAISVMRAVDRAILAAGGRYVL